MNNEIDPFKTYDQPDDEPVASLVPDEILAGRYRLIKQIGRGGMGVVWSSYETTAERKVVLKFVPSEVKNFESAVAQLKASFKKIHELQHQHICPVYTLEEDFSLGYYHAMKWLDGETLDQYILERTPLPMDKVLRILRPVAEALDYAHSKKIVHRDIKPSNIFVVIDEAKNITDVQVIDFGLASEIRSSLSRVSQMRFDTSGTRPYMAPEQWRGRPQSGATDQYALAVVAYELLSGYLPFDGDDFEMLRAAVMQDPVEPIREISESANTALITALAKDSGGRFESCIDFIEALGGENVNRARSVSKENASRERNEVERPDRAKPEVIPLMKRGNLFLEDSDWQQATTYFDRVLDIDPEYAPAYIGKLCAELKVKNEESLGDYEKPIADFGNFKKAVRFADTEYKATLERHNEKNQRIIWQEQSRIRQEQKRREEQEQIEQERRKKENEERERKRQDQEHSEVGRFCVEYGTDITALDENGMTLLHTAAELGKIEVVKFFVSKGADVCSKSEEGLTPLHFAANVEVAQALFSAGAAVNVKDNDGCTPLDMALGQGNMALIEYLESIGGKSGVR